MRVAEVPRHGDSGVEHLTGALRSPAPGRERAHSPPWPATCVTTPAMTRTTRRTVATSVPAAVRVGCRGARRDRSRPRGRGRRDCRHPGEAMRSLALLAAVSFCVACTTTTVGSFSDGTAQRWLAEKESTDM